MKIQGPGRPGPVDPARRAGGAAAPSDVKEGSGGERVKVSQQAVLLQQARSPEVPDAKIISRIREAIKKGAFEIDADKIADMLMKEENE